MKIYTSILCLVAPFFLAGQVPDTSQANLDDSTLDAQGIQSARLQRLADSARIADSLEKVLLEEKLSELRSTDLAEKARLQNQLDSINKAKQERDLSLKKNIDSLRASTKGIPVVFDKDTLFLVYAKLGPLSPSERAAYIVKKLNQLAEKTDFDTANFDLSHDQDSYDLTYEDMIVLSVTRKDAFWLDGELGAIAKQQKTLVINKIVSYRSEHGIYKTIMRIGLLLLVGLILFLMVRYLNVGFSKLVVRIARSSDKYMKGIKLRDYEFLSPERELQLALWLLNALKWLIILFIVYVSLPVIFSIFPSTEGVANTLFGYILNPVKGMFGAIIGFIPELIAIIVIIMVTRYFVRFLKFLASEIETGKLVIPGFYTDWALPTFNLLRVIIYAFSFVIIFPYLPGSNSPVFQGVSVFIGLLISLGSSSAIGNIIAGLVITYMRPFKLGDRVKIGDTVGDVIGKSMLVTRLRTIKNEDVSIPNAAILNGSTVNYSSSAADLGLILHTTVTIGYDVPWKQVHEVLIKAASKCDLIESEPPPFVFQTSLDDFYVSYQLNAYTHSPDKGSSIYSEMHANIQDGFNEAGIEILSPHYRAQRDGANMTIPPEYLPKGYESPGFTVQMKKDK